jgi:hypothetical protein
MTFSIMAVSIMSFGIKALSKMAFSIMALSIMSFGIKALRKMTFGIMALSIMTLSITLKNTTLSINDSPHNSIKCHFGFLKSYY